MDVQKPLSQSPYQSIAPGTVLVRPLLLKPQWMNGLSERLLVSHYVNHYGGALRRLNDIRARLAGVAWAHAPAFEINGLKREELIAASSVVLHEIYFKSLGGHGDNPPTGLTEPTSELARALARDFGSVTAWRDEFTGMAKALAGGSGWVVLVWSDRLGRLVNHWAADHAHGLAGAVPILALDMRDAHSNAGHDRDVLVDGKYRRLNWSGRLTETMEDQDAITRLEMNPNRSPFRIRIPLATSPRHDASLGHARAIIYPGSRAARATVPPPQNN